MVRYLVSTKTLKNLFNRFLENLAIVSLWRFAERYNRASDLVSPLAWEILEDEAAMREIEKAIKEGKDIQVKVNDKKKLERKP
jgi:hypothetical protein